MRRATKRTRGLERRTGTTVVPPEIEREYKIHMLNPGTREAMCGYPLDEREYGTSHLTGWYWASCPSCREEFELDSRAHGGFLHVAQPRR